MSRIINYKVGLHVLECCGHLRTFWQICNDGLRSVLLKLYKHCSVGAKARIAHPVEAPPVYNHCDELCVSHPQISSMAYSRAWTAIFLGTSGSNLPLHDRFNKSRWNYCVDEQSVWHWQLTRTKLRDIAMPTPPRDRLCIDFCDSVGLLHS